MRKIPGELQARLDSGATRLCRCWKIKRRDGVVYGFTDHDGPLVFDGLSFEASSGMDAGALQTSTGLSVDNGQAVGALSATSITDSDISSGRFDDAEIFHWLVDWSDPELRVLLFRGTLGEFRRMDGAFEVELRGIAENLNKPVGRSILKTCDRVLGDRKCGFDINRPGFSAGTEISAVLGSSQFTVAGLSDFGTNWFSAGTVTWLTGRNKGTTHSIRSDELPQQGSRIIDLWRQPGAPIEIGDGVRIVAGCNRTAETCRVKFNNFLNFRGFPHLPHQDWVGAYPKDGVLHDGSSLRP